MGTINSMHQGGFTASADLSTSQYRFAVISGNRTATFAGTAGIMAIGVIANKPTSGQAVDILVGPEVKIQLSATMTAGAKVMTTNTGLAAVATTGLIVLGTLVEGGVSGDVVAMIFEPNTVV
jgi:hypothetical protein